MRVLVACEESQRVCSAFRARGHEECLNTKIAGNWFNAGGKDNQKYRTKTFLGIALAMAEQWGSI